LITKKEETMRNTNKTAIEEKKMIEDINKLKLSLKFIPQLEKLKEQKDKVYVEFKVFRD